MQTSQTAETVDYSAIIHQIENRGRRTHKQAAQRQDVTEVTALKELPCCL